jgi:hypothetical protein
VILVHVVSLALIDLRDHDVVKAPASTQVLTCSSAIVFSVFSIWV